MCVCERVWSGLFRVEEHLCTFKNGGICIKWLWTVNAILLLTPCFNYIIMIVWFKIHHVGIQRQKQQDISLYHCAKHSNLTVSQTSKHVTKKKKMYILGGVCRLWCEVSFWVHRWLFLHHGHVVGLHILWRKSSSHSTKTWQRQFK